MIDVMNGTTIPGYEPWQLTSELRGYETTHCPSDRTDTPIRLIDKTGTKDSTQYSM